MPLYHPAFGLSPLSVRVLATLMGLLVALLWVRGRRTDGFAQGDGVSLLLAFGLGLRLLHALCVPAFEGHDERAHLYFVGYLVEHHALPRQPAQVDLSTPYYEAYQPPLFYLAAAPFYALAQALGADEGARLGSVRLFGVLLWWIAAQLSRRLFERLPLSADLRLLAMALVCLLPANIFVSSMVTNDNPLLPLSTCAFLVAMRYAGRPRDALALGVVTAALLLTKLSSASVVLGAFAFSLAQGYRARQAWPKLLVSLTAAGLLAALMWLPWLLRNHALYGEWLATDLGNPDANWPLWPGLQKVLRSLMGGFWAVAGRYATLSLWPGLGLLATALLTAGIVIDLRARNSRLRAWARQPEHVPWLLGVLVCFGSNLLLAVHFGLKTGMPHGRFLFPSLVPIAPLCAVGVVALAQRFGHGSPSALGIAGLLAFATAFGLFTLGMMGQGVAALALSVLVFLLTGLGVRVGRLQGSGRPS